MTGGKIRSSTSSGASSTGGRPGTSAISTPVSTRRIDGGTLSRLAMTATAATTASSRTSTWMVELIIGSQAACACQALPAAQRGAKCCDIALLGFVELGELWIDRLKPLDDRCG